jgi:hypothetical protein
LGKNDVQGRKLRGRTRGKDGRIGKQEQEAERIAVDWQC